LFYFGGGDGFGRRHEIGALREHRFKLQALDTGECPYQDQYEDESEDDLFGHGFSLWDMAVALSGETSKNPKKKHYWYGSGKLKTVFGLGDGSRV